VGEKTERERKSSVLEVSVDDAVAVKVVNGIENGADDDDNIVLDRLAFARTRSNSSPPVASSKER